MWRDIDLKVDIDRNTPISIEVNQADDLRISMYLYKSGVPVNLVEGEDTIIVNYANANGTITSDADIGRKFVGNMVIIHFPRNCTNSSGIAHMQVTINSNRQYEVNAQTTSFPIDIKIKQSVVDGKEVSKNVNSMIDSMNKANIQGQQIIKNIEETASKYPPSSQLYADVEDLKARKYGGENLLSDSGFLSGNIGDGFPWNVYNTNTTTAIEVSNSAFSGKSVKITSTTGEAGIRQYINYPRDFKSAYTVSLRVYGSTGTIIKISLESAQTISYTIKTENTWEDVVVTFDTNINKWNKGLVIESSAATSFYVQDVALWEGRNAFTYKPNSNDCIYDRIKISGQDLRLINKSGKYAGVGCLNSPFVDYGWGFYDIEVHSSKYKKIIAHNYSANDMLVCSCINGTWTDWEQIACQSFCKKPSNIIQDSTHRFVSDTEKNKWNMVTGSGALQQNSYCKLPNGLIMQWGVTSVSIPSKNSNTATATFATPFPNKLLTIQTNVNRNISTMDKTGCENIISNGIMASGIDVDKTKVDIFARDCIGSGDNWTFEIGWFAIGY